MRCILPPVFIIPNSVTSSEYSGRQTDEKPLGQETTTSLCAVLPIGYTFRTSCCDYVTPCPLLGDNYLVYSEIAWLCVCVRVCVALYVQYGCLGNVSALVSLLPGSLQGGGGGGGGRGRRGEEIGRANVFFSLSFITFTPFKTYPLFFF